jgi:hypothetical protein
VAVDGKSDHRRNSGWSASSSRPVMARLSPKGSRIPAWKVRGFGEAHAVNCLAITYPDRWLPPFLSPGRTESVR